MEETFTNDPRSTLTKRIKKYYGRLAIPLTQAQLEVLECIHELDILLCEHQLFFPHLGIYRIPLLASNIISEQTGFILFIVNDIFYKDNHFTTNKLGIYSQGRSQTEQTNPVIVPCKKEIPLNAQEPPSSSQLHQITEKITNKNHNSYAWLRSNKDISIQKAHKVRIQNNLDELISLYRTNAQQVDNYADWCLRTNIELYRKTNPNEYDRILFLSYSELLQAFREQRKLLIKYSDRITETTNRVIAKQRVQGQTQYAREALALVSLPIWSICPKCKARNRVRKLNMIKFSMECHKCGYASEYDFKDPDIVLYPDVVGKQILSSFLSPTVRVVGALPSYSQVVDECLQQVFGMVPPERKVIASKPVLQSLLSGKETIGDATLFFALLESDPEHLGNVLLQGSWNNDHIISSQLTLKYS